MALHFSNSSHSESHAMDELIKIETVNTNFQSFIEKGGLVDAGKLIQILGGPNEILNHYLSKSCDGELSQDQLQAVSELFTLVELQQFDGFKEDKLLSLNSGSM